VLTTFNNDSHTFFLDTSWCGKMLDGKVVYFENYYRQRSSTLALVLGSVLYIFKSAKTATMAEVPQKIPLLTEKETKSGYIIEQYRGFYNEEDLPCMILYLKPAHWWEHMFRSFKTVNIAERSSKFTRERELSYSTIMSALHALYHSIVNTCLQMWRYSF
jgi:hypothetical protein